MKNRLGIRREDARCVRGELNKSVGDAPPYQGQEVRTLCWSSPDEKAKKL